MKRPLIIVGVLVALIAAFLFVRSRGSSKPATSGETAGKTIEPPAPTPRAGSGAPDRASNDRGDQRDVLIDDDPAGVLRLEGQVIDADAAPVGGATVVLSSNPPRTTLSEDDGSFAFDGLVGRPYQVAARAPAGIAGPVTARLTDHLEPVVLKLRPASSVTVEVVDDKGAAVDGATVELRGLDSQRGTTAAGKATFAPVISDGYQVAAWAPGFARGYQFLAVAGEAVTTRIALRRGAAVSGKVVASGGDPVVGARVVYYGASDWSVQPDERLDGQLTDAAGRFKFDAVAAGSVRFEARHLDHAPGSSAIVKLDGINPVDDVEIELPAGATISGVVRDGGANPVAAARVRIGVAGAGMVSAAPRQVFSDDQGKFVVKGLPRRELEAVAVGETGASATEAIDATGGDVAAVELIIDVTATISGKVVDPEGEPVEGVQVSAGPDFRRGGGTDMQSWRLRGFPEDLTDAAGAFTLSGLAPGNYQVRATRSQQQRRSRGFLGESVAAKAGDSNVEIVLPVDGGVQGKVAFEDGAAPTAFTVAVRFAQQPFATKDGSFTIEELPPGDYDLSIRGNGFAPTTVKAKVVSAEIADVGTITVKKGRTIRGVVVAGGTPVPGATVFVGTQIFGTGSSNKAEFGGPPGARDTREATTDDNGGFAVSGFGRRDLTIVAEHEEHGRSRAVRLVAEDPAEQALTIVLEPFGSLTGTVKNGGEIVEGVIVSAQSATAPGALYGVASGADGVFRLDRLAPDTYKVSAMLGMNPMQGMGWFSKTVAVTSGKETKVDVAIVKGTITLIASAKAAGGTPVSGAAWIASGAVTARNGKELELKMAAQGDGSSGLNILLAGQPVRFKELVAGSYTVCLLPLPTEVQGMAGMQYFMQHGDQLPAFCKAVAVTDGPDEQAVEIDVEIPPVLPDE